MATATVTHPSTWISARRKSDGKSFFYVPGTPVRRRDGTIVTPVYMTAADGCTCPAAQNSRTGDCKHQQAVRAQEPRPAPAPRRNLLTGWGCMRTDCREEALDRGGVCLPHYEEARRSGARCERGGCQRVAVDEGYCSRHQLSDIFG